MKARVSMLLFIISFDIVAEGMDPDCQFTEEQCAAETRFENLDEKLSCVYEKLIDKIESDGFKSHHVSNEEIKQSFVQSQEIWFEFREAHCDVVYTLAGGSVRGLNGLECLIDMTVQRIEYLTVYSDW